MEASLHNALWACCIVGLACIPTIALWRRSRIASSILRSSVGGHARIACATALSASTWPQRLQASSSSASVASSRIAHAIGLSCCSRSVGSQAARHAASPSSSLCSSGAGSVASSTTCSRSCSSRSDSGAESDSTCSSVVGCRNSCDGVTKDPSTPPCATAGAPRQLRSALRSPAGSVSAPAVRKTKSVTFKSDDDGIVICTPPTAAALSMLASGAPAVSYRPAASQPHATSTAAKPAASCDAPPTPLVAEPAHPRPGPSPSSPAPSSAASTTTVAAATASRPQPQAQPRPSQSASQSAPRPAAAPATAPVPATSVAASARDAFLAPSAGRQRVLAALAEAKARHAHLGTTTTADNWPMPPEAYEPWRREAEERAVQREAEEARRRANRSERLASAPVLLVTERDAGIVQVGYAQRKAVASAAAAPPSEAAGGIAGGHGHGQEVSRLFGAPVRKAASKKTLGGSSGSGFESLFREVAAERMRRAEALVAQARA